MKKKKFLLRTLIPVGLSAVCVPAAMAQEAGAPAAQTQNSNASTDNKEGVATIVVNSFRSSLEKSLDLKQQAIGVRDSIVAEDIGKFPEANVAESLQRIPGVYLTRDGASNEGQRINIRGLGPQFSVTTINGAPVRTTSSANAGAAVRDFNYDVFASDLFGRVDFYKTPLAELEEGGIGGVVDLQTPRPFDRRGRVIRYNVSESYNDRSKKADPRYSFIFSDTWGDFGALVGYAHSKSTNLRDGFQSTGSYNTAALGRQNKGFFNFDLDYNDPRASLGSYTREQIDNAFLPRFFRAYGAENRRERDGLVTSLQYKTDQWDVSLDGLFSKLKDQRDEYTFGLPIRNSKTTNTSVAPGLPGHNGLVPINVFIDENNNLQGTFGNTDYLNENFFYDSQTKFSDVSLSAKYKLSSDLKLSALAARSHSEAWFTNNRVFTNAYGVNSTIDSTKNYLYPVLTSPIDFNDRSLYKDPALGYGYNEEGDRADALKLAIDYDYELPWGFKGHLKTGLSKDSIEKRVLKQNGTTIGSTQQLSIGTTLAALGSSATQYMKQGTPLANFGADASSTFPRSWAHFDRDFMMNVLDPIRANKSAPIDTANSFKTVEDVTSLFVQSDFAGNVLDRELRVNVGVRYAKTDTHINNYKQAPVTDANGNVVKNPDGSTKTQFVPNTEDGEYNNVLPSVSASYELMPDLIVRGSAGRTITRAALSVIAANTVIPNPFGTTATSGNPNLLPQLSDQFDASAEWYFSKGSLASLGLFRKNMKDVTVAQTQVVPFSSLGLPDTALAPNLYDPATGKPDPQLPIQLSTFYNAGKRHIDGFELAYQQAFSFLPAPWNGLGTMASYTRVHAPINPWIGTDGTRYTVWDIPRYSYSLTAYYEYGPWALRTSYNYKDRSIINTTGNADNLQMWAAGRAYVDASISYKLNDNLEVRFDAMNLSNGRNEVYMVDPSGKYGDGHSRTDNLMPDGRTFMVGLRGKY